MNGSHGGQATAAKRRGEEWIGCSCSLHKRRFQAEPEEPRASWWQIARQSVWLLFFFAVVIYALPVVMEAAR